MNRQKLLPLFYELWEHFSVRRKVQFCLLLALTIASSIFELFSIGMVLPFLAAIATPDRVMQSEMLQPILTFYPEITTNDLVILLSILFVTAIVVSGVFRITNLWAGLRFSYSAGADLSANIYRRTLYQPYVIHASRNSSQIIDGVTNKTSIVIHTINAVLVLISTTILLALILGGLLIVNPLMTSITFGVLVLIYGVIILFVRYRLARNGELVSINSIKVLRSLQEGLGGIRDVLLDGAQELYCSIFKEADYPLRRAQERNQFIGQSPKYFLEVLGMLVLIGVGMNLSKQSGGIIYAVPLMGLLAVGIQRLLPAFQQTFQAWSIIKSNQTILQDVVALLDQQIPAGVGHIKEIPFSNVINLRNISFAYAGSEKLTLSNISCSIPKGARVGFVGKTGSGKSTLIDMIMGLLTPSSGEILIDQLKISELNMRGWQKHIAHVPQSIFLSDGTIEENIAFGISLNDIDQQQVIAAAKMAQIADDINSWPMQYKTKVGERGIQLSGGQRQRIGIARALYKKADVIVFDEATSALDAATERLVMEAIGGLSKNLTILLVAHRISTLQVCDFVVELDAGEIKWTGSYGAYLKRNPGQFLEEKFLRLI
jgi:ABC-type bacteriocin/lantibiotic exporter with double-glycine peptidase domain